MKSPEKSNPKVLIWDIEWKPTLAYVWRAWDESVNPDQIVEHGGLLCIGWKWLGEEETHILAEWDRGGHSKMVRKFYDIYSSADASVTFNGAKYDEKKMLGEFLLEGLPPPPKITQIDCIKTIKKFGFFRNALGFVGPFLGLESKLEHEGINLWKKSMGGDKDARERMSDYCARDVDLLEDLYMKIRPYIYDHPFLGEIQAGGCGVCGSHKTQKRGFSRTRCYITQRLQCQDCGAWQSGARKKVA